MFFLNKYSQRGITLLETAGIAVVLSSISILGLGAADLYSKSVTLHRSMDKASSLVASHPLSVEVTTGGDISIDVRESDLTAELTGVVDAIAQDLEESFLDLPHGGYKVEAFFQAAEINPVSGAFIGFGLPSPVIQKGDLPIDPRINEESDPVEKLMELAAIQGVDGSSTVAEPSAQRVFSNNGWRYLPKSVLAAVRIVLNVDQTPTHMIQKAIGRPSQLFDVKAIHLRGGLQ